MQLFLIAIFCALIVSACTDSPSSSNDEDNVTEQNPTVDRHPTGCGVFYNPLFVDGDIRIENVKMKIGDSPDYDYKQAVGDTPARDKITKHFRTEYDVLPETPEIDRLDATLIIVVPHTMTGTFELSDERQDARVGGQLIFNGGAPSGYGTVVSGTLIVTENKKDGSFRREIHGRVDGIWERSDGKRIAISADFSHC